MSGELSTKTNDILRGRGDAGAEIAREAGKADVRGIAVEFTLSRPPENNKNIGFRIITKYGIKWKYVLQTIPYLQNHTLLR